MDFTFGIITNGSNDNYISKIVHSIREQYIPNYEIIIVGKCNIFGQDIKNIQFNENQKAAWITRKKNIITREAKFENIVFLHDYIMFLPGWYVGQQKAGNDFYIRMDKILNYDNTRYRDWTLWHTNGNDMDSILSNRECLIPYDFKNLSKFMYISGSYWIAKKIVMEEFPLNENLSWGQGEDVEWSKQVRQIYKFNMNVNSSVQIIKQGKHPIFSEPTLPTLEKIKEING